MPLTGSAYLKHSAATQVRLRARSRLGLETRGARLITGEYPLQYNHFRAIARI
jgi:hypothetical protein